MVFFRCLRLALLLVVGLSAEGLFTALHAQATLEVILQSEDADAEVAFQVVRALNSGIGLERAATTNAQGRVRFRGLPTAGEYSVVLASSLVELIEPATGIALVDGKTTSLTVSIQERERDLQPVLVRAYTPVSINVGDAEVASELAIAELERLPVEGRDITRALYRLPNVSPATGFFPEAPTVSINGANSLYVNYQIDGLENNENFLGGQRFNVPVGFTRHITVLSNNFGAEHGLTTNGIVNITTPSGTNAWKGEVFYLTRPGPVIDAASPYAQRDLSGNQVKDGFMRHQAGVAVGGPLKQDKTFFYLNLEQTLDVKDNLLNAPALGVNTTVQGQNRFSYGSLKIDQRWSPRWTSSWRANLGLVGIERQGGGLEGGVSFPSAGNVQTRNGGNLAWKNAYTGEKLTWESNAQYGLFRWDYADPTGATAEPENQSQVTILDQSGMTAAVIGHPGFVFREREDALTLQQRFALDLGAHTLHFGGQLRHSVFSLFGGGNPNGNYTVQLSDAELAALSPAGEGLQPTDLPADVQVLDYAVELRPASFGRSQTITSFWLEDQWTATERLNLSLGLRYDLDNLSRGGAGGSGLDNLDMDNIAPRVSANYRIDERSSIRAGYGIYYDKILYAVVSDALQFNSTGADYRAQVGELVAQGILPADTDLDAVLHEGNLTANAANVDYLQGPTAASLQDQRDQAFSNERRILNPEGYQNPYSHQIMLGYQRKTGAHTRFYVDLMHNRSHNLFRLRDLNAPEAYPIDPDNVVVRSQAEADATRPVPIFQDADGAFAVVDGDTLRGVARNVVVTESAGRSNYWAVNFTWQKLRGDGNWTLRLVYTLSFLENNTEDINFRAMDANNFEAEWGPSINDRTHLINGIASWFPHRNVTFTLAALLQSGQPINRVPDASVYGTTDLNGDGRSFGDAYVGNSDRAPGESRNSDRLPWATTFDFSAYYTLPLSAEARADASRSSGSRLEFSASIFNLLNAENLSGYANNATQSNQIQAGPASSGVLVRRNAAPPRQFQFGVRWLFGG